MGNLHREQLRHLRTSLGGTLRLAEVTVVSDRSLLIGVSLLSLISFLGIFADVIAPYDPMQTGLSPGLEPPSQRFLMGTDQLGRDIFSWVIYGIRTALIVGILSTAISLSLIHI